MKTINIKPKILGMYLSDTKKVYTSADPSQNSFFTKEGVNYLPILNMFEIKSYEDIVFCDGKLTTNEINTHNTTVANKNNIYLDQDYIEKTRIDITQNDLLLGPVNIVLNLTDYNITIGLSNEYRKTYKGIKSAPLSEYNGKVIILSITSFNNPKMIHNTFTYSNYFTTLIDKFRAKNNSKYSEIIEMLEYLNTTWGDAKLKYRLEGGSCIKLVTAIEVDIGDIVNDSAKTIYVPNKGMTISTEDIVAMPDHPGTDAIFNTGDIKEYIRNNSFICYIIDNNDKISDRYINIAGHVTKIMKFKNPNMVSGLYFLRTSDTGKTSSESICKLEEIDSNNFVYKSIEEANEGADIRSKYKDSLEKAKQELESLKLDKTNEGLLLKSELERKNLELKLDYETKLKEQMLEHEREIQELRINLEHNKINNEETTFKNKAEYETFKHFIEEMSLKTKKNYEEDKYKRETTVETIKTVGSIAGLVIGLYTIYTKFKKI